MNIYLTSCFYTGTLPYLNWMDPLWLLWASPVWSCCEKRPSSGSVFYIIKVVVEVSPFHLALSVHCHSSHQVVFKPSKSPSRDLGVVHFINQLKRVSLSSGTPGCDPQTTQVEFITNSRQLTLSEFRHWFVFPLKEWDPFLPGEDSKDEGGAKGWVTFVLFDKLALIHPVWAQCFSTLGSYGS